MLEKTPAKMKKIIICLLFFLGFILIFPKIVLAACSFLMTDQVAPGGTVNVSVEGLEGPGQCSSPGKQVLCRQNPAHTNCYIEYYYVVRDESGRVVKDSGRNHDNDKVIQVRCGDSGKWVFSFPADPSWAQLGTYQVAIHQEIGAHKPFCLPPSNTLLVTNDPNPTVVVTTTYKFCQGTKEEVKKCNDCTENNDSWTAIGCVPTSNTTEFVGWLIGQAIGVAGGIAFLMMIFASFIIITSTGNPERLQQGKELLGSALGGLLFIIFSIYLLRLIGVSILQIPGFGQ
jgi:hypothetical protein